MLDLVLASFCNLPLARRRHEFQKKKKVGTRVPPRGSLAASHGAPQLSMERKDPEAGGTIIHFLSY
jgi:hypothetical protein